MHRFSSVSPHLLQWCWLCFLEDLEEGLTGGCGSGVDGEGFCLGVLLGGKDEEGLCLVGFGDFEALCEDLWCLLIVTEVEMGLVCSGEGGFEM